MVERRLIPKPTKQKNRPEQLTLDSCEDTQNAARYGNGWAADIYSLLAPKFGDKGALHLIRTLLLQGNIVRILEQVGFAACGKLGRFCCAYLCADWFWPVAALISVVKIIFALVHFVFLSRNRLAARCAVEQNRDYRVRDSVSSIICTSPENKCLKIETVLTSSRIAAPSADPSMIVVSVKHF